MTPKQRAILEFLVYHPGATTREVAEGLGTNMNIRAALDGLYAAGLLKREHERDAPQGTPMRWWRSWGAR